MKIGLKGAILLAWMAYKLGKDAAERERALGHPLSPYQHFRILGQEAQRKYGPAAEQYGSSLSRIGDYIQ